MWKLAAILFIIIGPTLAGIGALVPLTVYGVNEFNPLLLAIAAGIGLLIAVPVSLVVGKKVNDAIRPRRLA
jgi:hypothetical protein